LFAIGPDHNLSISALLYRSFNIDLVNLGNSANYPGLYINTRDYWLHKNNDRTVGFSIWLVNYTPSLKGGQFGLLN